MTVGMVLNVPQERGISSKVSRSSCQRALGAQNLGQTRHSSLESGKTGTYIGHENTEKE